MRRKTCDGMPWKICVGVFLMLRTLLFLRRLQELRVEAASCRDDATAVVFMDTRSAYFRYDYAQGPLTC
jgi:hypothetical protein